VNFDRCDPYCLVVIISDLFYKRNVGFNVPFKIPELGNRYKVWWKYRNIVLNINGYERRDNRRGLSLPQKCQIPSRNGKILSESELLKFQFKNKSKQVGWSRIEVLHQKVALLDLDLRQQSSLDPTSFRNAIKVASCTTWAEYSRDLPSRRNGRGGQWRAFGTLPPEFQDGCVLLEDNNAIDTAYVLKVGISPNLYKGRSLNPHQKVPAFGREKRDSLEQLVNQGKALKITWQTPTIGSNSNLSSMPRNRAFLRDDGMTCFSTVCMKSGALSHQVLARILSVW